MNNTAWDIDNNGDSNTISEPIVARRSNLTKSSNAFGFEDFEDQEDQNTHSSSRRKHMHRVVMVMEEDCDDYNFEKSADRKEQKELSASLKEQDKNVNGARPLKTISFTSKTNELAEPDLVEKIPKTTNKESIALASTSSTASIENQEDAFVHELVREFLKIQGHLDVLQALDEEMPMAHLRLDEKQLKSFHHKVVTRKVRKLAEEEQQESTGSGHFQTRLEQFIASWNLTVHERELPSRRHHRKHKKEVQVSEAQDASTSSADKTSKKSSSSSSSKVRVKPSLKVETVESKSPQEIEEDFNRLGCPGHTPKARNEDANAFLYEEPGHTPKARTDDLIVQGLVDEEQHISGPFPAENLSSKTMTSSTTTLQPIIGRRRSSISIPSKAEKDAETSEGQGNDSSNKRRVQVGEEGNTPKKEYFFYRETPPQFVTETAEAAKEIFDKLAQNPGFNAPSLSTERYVELSSGEVSKYKIGQEVKALGVNRDVNGIVAKIYGSRQCGSSGPGTIVIDTCPSSEVKPSTTINTTTCSTAAKNVSLSVESDALFDAGDEELMDQLLQ